MSSKNKVEVDSISRETQRMVSESHVRLPYYKPKQKSLKDFLNRAKGSKECQASITGPKHLLQKAWDFIESKEQSVKQFFSEDCHQDENNEELSSSNCEKELIVKEKHISSHNSDDEENSENNFITQSESVKDEDNILFSSNDDDEEDNDNILFSSNNDEENNSNQITSLCPDQTLIQQDISEEDENSKFSANSINLEDNGHNVVDNENKVKKDLCKKFIDDEAELSELDSSSDDENNLINFCDSGEEFSKKKRRKLVLLSESSDDDMDNNRFDEKNLSTEVQPKMSNDLIPLFNDSETNISTQLLMGLCSGQFQTQETQNGPEDVQDSEDGFDSDVPFNDAESIKNEVDEKALQLTSAKDFFDDEAELSESDWSSDDEEHLIDVMDKLEEEEGDKDKLDENLVKDGLDKIYMRQLLDDDQQQVTALKEMLLEDGDLHSDSGRKRKFQWDETDQNDFALKKPLFSDNEDEYENDEILSDDDKTDQWRKERYKREAYLYHQNDSEDDEVSDVLQPPDPVVKKIHVNIKNVIRPDTTRFKENDESVQINNETKVDENNFNIKSTSVRLTTETNQIDSNDFINFQNTNMMLPKPSKLLKGSFLNQSNNKMVNLLLYGNKKSTISKSVSTVTANLNNPFAYLLKNDQKQDI